MVNPFMLNPFLPGDLLEVILLKITVDLLLTATTIQPQINHVPTIMGEKYMVVMWHCLGYYRIGN